MDVAGTLSDGYAKRKVCGADYGNEAAARGERVTTECAKAAKGIEEHADRLTGPYIFSVACTNW